MKFDKKNPIKHANNVSIRKGDTVVVLAGKDKGKKGKVMTVDPIANTCVVEGVNIVIKHKKARSTQQKSERTKMAAPIHISNVQILCKCGKATRVAHKINEKGIKNRVCAKCSEVLDKKFVKTKEKAADDAEAKKDGDEEKKEVKKPLQRREVKSVADVKIKKPLSTSSKPSAGTTHRKMGGG